MNNDLEQKLKDLSDRLVNAGRPADADLILEAIKKIRE